LLALGGLALAAANDGGSSAAATGPVAASSCAIGHWVGAWAAVPSDGSDYPEHAPLAARTSRTVVTPLFGGQRVRVRLSNRFGTSPVRLDAVRIGVSAGGAALVPRSSRRLEFGGSPAVTLGAGEDVLSDGIATRVRPFQTLAVSIYVDPASNARPTRHFVAQQTSYLTTAGTGNHTADTAADAFSEATASRFIVSGIDVRSPRRSGSVVAFGDSLTDGMQADGGGLDRDVRYPDFLARRLQAAPGPNRLSVLNAGISGNRVTRGSVLAVFGLTAIDRLRKDAISQPGVRDVIVLEGTNDLAHNESARPIISALRALVVRLERSGTRIKTFLGTVPPNKGDDEQAPIDAIRSQLNRWIRHQRAADGYIDFSRALRDPKHPNRLDPRFDSGDHLHPSAAGYKAMARAVPLGELASTCDHG